MSRSNSTDSADAAAGVVFLFYVVVGMFTSAYYFLHRTGCDFLGCAGAYSESFAVGFLWPFYWLWRAIFWIMLWTV